MIYEKEVMLKKMPQKIKSLLLDYDQYHLWQPSFKGINKVKGKPGETGFVGILNYQNQQDFFQVKVTIDRNDLPTYLVEFFEMDEVYIRCVHNFINQPEGILWQQTVFVEIGEKSNINKDRIESSTLENMMSFKQFIELN